MWARTDDVCQGERMISSHRTTTTVVNAILVVLVGALATGACGDNSANPSPAGAGTNTLVGSVGELPDGCPAADGSAATKQQFDGPPPFCLLQGQLYTATITTNHGVVRATLLPNIAPNTVNSFVYLARQHYFDTTTCHRAIRGFVVQCGDPTATGRGGPGYEFADELDKISPYQIGSLAMANSGPNTNGSQWFIVTGADGQQLDQNYTLFGQVIDDDVPIVAALDQLANPGDGPPLEPIDIVSITITVS